MAISLTKRAVKGSPLTHSEVDQNWTDIETLSNANESGITALQTSVDSVSGPDGNLIINGAMDIWQRGTSFTGLTGTTDAYTSDRFRYASSGTLSSVVTIERSLTVPTNTQASVTPNYSLKLSVTTADASPASTNSLSIQYNQEGFEYAQVRGNTYTLSFWVRSSKVGTYCVSFRNNGSDRSYVAEYTVNAPNTWEKKTITVTFNYTGGTDAFLNGLGLRVDFTLMSGSTFHTSPGAWQSGSFIATSNQVNITDSTSNDFHLTLVKLEEGSTATRFLKRNFVQEVSLCQRYYEKSYSFFTNPGAVTNTGAKSGTMAKASTAVDSIQTDFKSEKRTTPTIVWYSSDTGASGNIFNSTTTMDAAVSSSSLVGTSNTGYPNTGASQADGDTLRAHWTADAEL